MKTQRGFTLISLLAVVGVVGVLSAVLFPSFATPAGGFKGELALILSHNSGQTTETLAQIKQDEENGRRALAIYTIEMMKHRKSLRQQWIKRKELQARHQHRR
jgi:hypothetical protein